MFTYLYIIKHSQNNPQRKPLIAVSIVVPFRVFGDSIHPVWRLHSPRLEALNALPDIVPEIDLPLLGSLREFNLLKH